MLRLPPATDLVARRARGRRARGHALVLCPSAAMAGTVGAPAAPGRAWRSPRHPGGLGPRRGGRRPWSAPGPRRGRRSADLAAVVVLDEHDEAHQQEQAPTWHARDVAIERARRAGVPCVLTCRARRSRRWRGASCSPPTARATSGPAGRSSRWSTSASEDPRTGLLSAAPLVRLLRSDRRVLCVLNRTGRARLLACAACGELARCERCDAAVAQPRATSWCCVRCGAVRPAGVRGVRRRRGCKALRRA